MEQLRLYLWLIIILSIIIMELGFLHLIKPQLYWGRDKWKYKDADEPSERYKDMIVIKGAIAIAMGLLMLVFAIEVLTNGYYREENEAESRNNIFSGANYLDPNSSYDEDTKNTASFIMEQLEKQTESSASEDVETSEPSE